MTTIYRITNALRRAVRRLSLNALADIIIAALACLFLGTAVQAADPAPRSFDIPAQSLEGALIAFGTQSGIEVLFNSDTSKDLRSPGVSGTHTPDHALRLLLAGTGLTAKVTSTGAVTIERPIIDPLRELVARAKEPLRLAETETKPQAPVRKSEDGPTVLPEMTVTASPTDATSYSVPNATTATKTDTPIMETPVSIQVVPKQVLQDQQAYRIQDALKNVSGVQQRFSTGGHDSFIVRGFELGEIVYRNGIMVPRSNYDLTNVAQVEVLKGPASILYGRIEPGGLINVVTKRPQAQPYYSLEQRFGSYDYYRTQFDTTGPITKDGSLLYGFDLSHLNSDSFRDFSFNERIFVAPALTWRPSEDTELNLTLEYLNDDFVYNSGIPAFGDRIAPVPISREYGQPGLNDNRENTLLDFNWSHRFNNTWKFQNGVVWQTSDAKYNEIYAINSASVIGTRIARETWFGHEDSDMHTVYANLNGTFDTWRVAHNVLIGADYYSLEGVSLQTVISPLDTIDVFNPVYPVIDVDKQILSQRPNLKGAGENSWYGVYFQDEITLWNKLHILGGGRYDWATVTSGFDDPAVFRTDTLRDSQFSPRVGLVYQPWNWLSIYSHYVESFGSNNGRSQTGKPFEPQTATQYEGGVKTELFGGRLTSTVAYYHLTKNNLLTVDPDNQRFSIALGEARSRGVEVDIAGQISDGLSLIATYALTDTEITKDFSGLQGKRLPYVPLHSGSVWLKYDFQQEPLEGLSLGGGVFLADRRFGDADNSFHDEGYARVDLYAAYRYKLGPTHLTAQLNLNNVTDTEYFILRSRANNLPVEPLTVFGSLRLEY